MQRQDRELTHRGKGTSRPTRLLGAREISRKVDKVAVLRLFGWALAIRVDDPFASRASPSHGVNDQIGSNAFPGRCAHPGDVRDTGNGRSTGNQSLNLNTPKDGHVWCVLCQRSHRPFDDRSSPGNASHGFIARTRCPVGYGRGERLTIEIVHPHATSAKQAIRQLRQFNVTDHPKSGMETMGLPELGNARAVPRIPTADGSLWMVCPVGLEDRNTVTVASEHHCRAQANRAAAANDDLAHPFLLRRPDAARRGLLLFTKRRCGVVSCRRSRRTTAISNRRSVPSWPSSIRSGSRGKY